MPKTILNNKLNDAFVTDFVELCAGIDPEEALALLSAQDWAGEKAQTERERPARERFISTLNGRLKKLDYEPTPDKVIEIAHSVASQMN